MKSKLLFVMGAFMFVFAGIAYTGEPDLKEGLWEITVEISSPDMPKQMMTQRFTQCITKDKSVPEITEGKGEDSEACKMEYRNIKGNMVDWKVVCKDKEGVTVSEGRIIYKGDTFTGEVKIKESDEMEMLQKMSGKWIGKCPDSK